MKKVFSFVLIFMMIIAVVACEGVAPTTLDIPTDNLTTEIETTHNPTANNPTTINPTTFPPITTEPTTTHPTSTEPIIIDLELNNYDKFYYTNEDFNLNSLEIYAIYEDQSKEIIDSNLITIRGYNSSSPGEKSLYAIYDNLNLELDYVILEDYAFEITNPYYEDAINLKGFLLEHKLKEINDQHVTLLTYASARYVLQDSDRDPNNSSNIILVYIGTSINGDWDSGATWNREHVWPQSRLGTYAGGYDSPDIPNIATDIHNLKPADPDENYNRSNHYFDNLTTDDTYEPRDEVKGDIARIIFYMATMYTNLTLNNDPDSQSHEETMGILSVLLEWHDLDPVDDFERNRNEVIFSYQGNRNPFIDYPDFVELIWGRTEE